MRKKVFNSNKKSYCKVNESRYNHKSQKSLFEDDWDDEDDDCDDEDDDWDDPSTYAHCGDWEDEPENCAFCADDDCPLNRS